MVKDVKGYFMPKLIDTPEGTDMIGVRKKVNNLLSKARNSAVATVVQNRINVFYVESLKQVFAIHIRFRNYHLRILPRMEKCYMRQC